MHPHRLVVLVLALGVVVLSGVADADRAGPDVLVITADGNALPRCVARGARVEIVHSGDEARGEVLRWSSDGGMPRTVLSITGLTEGIREYRTLRFRVRSDSVFSHPPQVALSSDEGAVFADLSR